MNVPDPQWCDGWTPNGANYKFARWEMPWGWVAVVQEGNEDGIWVSLDECYPLNPGDLRTLASILQRASYIAEGAVNPFE